MRTFPLIQLGIIIALVACSPYPRDVAGTLDAVKGTRTVRVGLIAGGMNDANRALAAAYLDRVRRATAATPHFITGAADPLLIQLEAGELDIVIGDIAQDSPWLTDVAVLEPLAQRKVGSHTVGLSPIARNGENAWIMLLERAVRDSKAAG